MADYTSIKQLATACGVSHKTASTWLRRKDFPVQREAPWSDDDVEELKVWRKVKLQPNRADPAYQGRTSVEPPTDEQDKDYWLMRKYRAQALQQEGRLLDTDAVSRAWQQTKAEERDQWLQLAAAVQGLLGLSDDQTQQLDDFIRRTLNGLADHMVNLADAARSVPGGGEGVPATGTDGAERVGGDASLHASEHDGESRPVEE